MDRKIRFRQFMVFLLWISMTAFCNGAEYGIKDPAALAFESQCYCKSTEQKWPPSTATIVRKVDEACNVLKSEGTAVFPKFSGQGSPFIFSGTYIWVHDLNSAKILMHPIQYKMVGKDLRKLTDRNGKNFFEVMNRQVRRNGEAWVSYEWPKHGSNEFALKISFVKKCHTQDGLDVVVGCGIYNANEAELKNLVIH